jgi:hypothetical protein
MTMHMMNILDRTGHTNVTWDPDDKVSVADAKDKFEEMIRRGYTAFAINTTEDDGITIEEKGTRITVFDPKAGKVMMIPQLVGG